MIKERIDGNTADEVWRKLFVKKVFNNKEGSILIVSLIVAVLLTTFSMGYLGLLVAESSNTGKAHRSNTALHIAESGIEDAIWELKHNSPNFNPPDGWSGSNPVIKTASLVTASGENLGEYTVQVTGPSGSTPVIEAVGRALFQGTTLAETRTVEITLQASTGTLSMWQEK